jgi:hypothetical protein
MALCCAAGTVTWIKATSLPPARIPRVDVTATANDTTNALMRTNASEDKHYVRGPENAPPIPRALISFIIHESGRARAKCAGLDHRPLNYCRSAMEFTLLEASRERILAAANFPWLREAHPGREIWSAARGVRRAMP